MALFTNKEDLTLPFLTKVVQLDTSNTAELGTFIQQYVDSAKFSDDAQKEYAQYVATQGLEGDNFENVVKVCELSKRIMLDLGQKDTVNWKDAKNVEANQPRLTLRHVVENRNPEYVPANCIRIFWVSQNEAFIAKVNSELMNLLMRVAQEGKSPVSICPVCEKPFVKGRRAECSYRCQHRATERRRYANLFSPDGKTTEKPSEKK